jgi:hypothetical protein
MRFPPLSGAREASTQRTVAEIRETIASDPDTGDPETRN